MHQVLPIARDAVRTLWRDKRLWLFGFFVAAAGATGGLQLEQPAEGAVSMPPWVVGLTVAAGLLGLLMMALHVVSEGALIHAVLRERRGERASLGDGWRAGWSVAGRVLVIKALVGAGRQGDRGAHRAGPRQRTEDRPAGARRAPGRDGAVAGASRAARPGGGAMTEETPPEDGPLLEAFETLEPDGPSVERMEGVVLAAHALAQRPLAAEWLELLRARPITGTLLLAAAAVILVAATPLGALLALAGRWI